MEVMETLENKKLNIASLLGVSILLKQMLEQDLLTHEEADAVMRKIVIDNGFSEIEVLTLINRIHGENHPIKKPGVVKQKS